MGFLDDIFNSDSYGGELARLLGYPVPQLDASSAGFPDSYGNYGGVQYPIFGQAPQPAATQELAARSQTPAPPAPEVNRPAPLEQPSFGGNVGAALNNLNSGGNPITGLFNVFKGLATGERTDKQGIEQQNQVSAFRALVQAGVPPATAQAAVLNPEVFKAIAPEYFGGFKVVQTGETPVGKEFNLQGPGGKFYKIGSEKGPGQVVGGETGTTGFGQSLLAPGVKQMDSSLTGEDYLNQFAPEVKAAVKAYINGDVMPTGNPRLTGLVNFAKQVAQKYGQDLGIPVNDSIYAGKRKLQTEIASSSPNTMGGILANGKSAFDHLASFSDKLVNLNNASGPDIPFGGQIGTLANVVTNQIAPTPETKGKIAAVRDNALKYGQEATKFYAGTGGGVEERMGALNNIAGASTIAQEQAEYLQTEKDLMLARLNQKEQQIASIMGPDYLKDHPVRTPDFEKMVAKIDENIAKLRGQSPQTAAQPMTLPQGWKFLGTR